MDGCLGACLCVCVCVCVCVFVCLIVEQERGMKDEQTEKRWTCTPRHPSTYLHNTSIHTHPYIQTYLLLCKHLDAGADDIDTTFIGCIQFKHRRAWVCVCVCVCVRVSMSE